uniref:non-specific serine/threonine protein kinase n=1 Tax=Salix viminalis TaxID=40686 RepID=A0A6N2MD42_SALVM
MSGKKPIFLLIHFLIRFLFQHADSKFHDQEQAVLLRLKQHWQNPLSLEHWTPSNTSHCTWPEVVCTNNYITQLILDNKNISGTIPPFLSHLKNLTFLNFYNNNIVGKIPVALYNLSKLEILDLSQNYIVGTIPDGIDRLARLSCLKLDANNLSGDIPAAIGLLPELRTLQLNDNQFNGTFPPEIGNLSKLEELTMAHNGFSSSRLPSNFTQLKKLKELWIAGANLIGEIPQMIGEMVALEHLDLSSNELTGNIPGSLFMLKNLKFCSSHKLAIRGDPQVVEALNLTFVDLSQNNLTGTIPVDFGKLDKLSGLHLYFNQLSGGIPESIGRLPALKDFALFSNNLSGSIPPDLGRYSALEAFQVCSNRLTGNLPEYLCHGGSLTGVVAFDNKLGGELPKSLENCSSLRTVSISNNAFFGNIPVGLWTALNLQQLMISDNSFTGELPNEVSTSLFAAGDEFSGSITIEGNSWRNLVVFNASNNLFTGTVPLELTTLRNLTVLLLDKNQLNGALPSDIMSWKSLTILNLSQNQLSGQIPEKFGFLPGLVKLDLSDNQFSGKIPPQLGSLRLTFLNLSSNHLMGQIPTEYENVAYATSFLNNPGLCTRRSSVYLKVCNSRPQKPSKTSTQFLALILSSLIAAFLLASLFAFITIRVHRKINHILDPEWKFIHFHMLNFTESDIFSGLKERNLIGSGGSGQVYRVAANGFGSVAVKRISNHRNSDLKLEKEFLAEIEILGTLRHLNIVKLLCCISNDNSKLLVYEYMENHSLDQWLHSEKKAESSSASMNHVALDWSKRLQIAVGAAQGLCYLHHDCSPPIVHRDVKSSNILLDSHFNAKIADFGLARMLVKQGELATVSAVAGSLGYMAPVRVNEKTDVYSFGVVLLELTTGKAANHGDEDTCLAKWAWRHMQEEKPIVDVLDEEIKEPCCVDEMCVVFKLGVFCTSILPSERPNMKEILQILLGRNPRWVCGRKNMRHAEHASTPLLNSSKSDGKMVKMNPIMVSFHFLTLFLLFPSHASSQLNDQEQAVLLRLKQFWQNSSSLEGWTPSNSSHCTWPGVVCTNNSITQLLLDNKNIYGTIPSFISDLKNLRVLNFSNNSIGGKFPVAVYDISKLEISDLSQNYFVGSIPDDIDSLSRLTYLNLCANNFTGNIPASIGRIPELRTLYLNDNLFDGTFPPEIGNLSKLEQLNMAGNGFLPSKLPSNFTQLKKLKELCISGANLIGEIPQMIGEMVALEHLDLSSNELTGNIPGSLFMLKNLKVLFLHINSLSGEIPQVVESLNLNVIDLSMNNLTGTIPVDFGKLDKLSGLSLSCNQLSGEIPESIGRLPALKDFALFSNNLSGSIPPDLGRYSALETFQVPSNRLTGNLPEYLCHGGSLIGVVAFDNKLGGELPKSLENCSSLQIVRISNNAFFGNIPVGLWTASNLQQLMINDNSFTGELPNEVSTSLSRLEISNNRFSGSITIEGNSWRNLVVFNASNNLFTGAIPQELTAFRNLTTLLLDKNRLTGALPPIISWKSLTTLNLSQNQLSGEIPVEIAFLPHLLELDLSDNKFSGQIPPQLGLLRLTSLNLSSNLLFGKIPTDISSSFLNNPGLCASRPSLYLKVCFSRPQKSSKTSTPLLALISSVLITSFLLALLFSFIIIRVHRKRSHGSDSEWKFINFQRLNFTGSNILSGLTESNLIGSGGSGKVYRVAANGSIVVAVKRIWNNRPLEHKLEKEFLAEVEILSTIRHLNIVKLLCCITNDKSKLLVYEYLVNHSLDQWLHTENRSNSAPSSGNHVVLDWPKRLQIAVGAAQGLCYLHHDCSPPILHRDVKSSNILLDSEFNAKIADFGLARMLVKQEELATVSAVAGSFGYIAPVGALDEEIKEPCYVDEMSNVFQLGVFCTSTVPSARPQMKEVLQILLGRSHPLVYGVKNTRRDGAARSVLPPSRLLAPIVHRDVKSSNILLDSHFNAKIADSLSKMLVKQGELATVSAVAGSLVHGSRVCSTVRVNEKLMFIASELSS